MKKLLILFLLLTLGSRLSYAHTTKIRVWEHTLNDSGIITDTLIHALEITKKEYGDYELLLSNEMGQDRALRELATGRIDLTHFIATEAREAQAIPIRIPIMQGLLGYRICLIKKENQNKFSEITNKQQWLEKNITIGQHINWPDTEILKSNGLNVITTYKAELLFQQLSKNRVDCFARGANEITSDLVNHSSLGLVIENNIVLHYPFPLFFFVNPEKPLLAERLRLGLTRLHQKGETDKLFDSYYRELLEQLNLKKRVFIELHNPTLSQQTIDALKAPTTRFKTTYFSAQQK